MLSALEQFGLICILILALQFFRKLYSIFITYGKIAFGINAIDLTVVGKGKWAVVTGATDGIGKAYAEDLAKKGINIVLISRTLDKLENIATIIRTKYGVDTKIILANFTRIDKIYHEIDKQLNGLNIAVLINNVGASYPYPEYFLQVKDREELYTTIINCNIYSVTQMCRIVMPGMVERRCGIIINVSSTAAQIPSPLLTVYAATKAYVDKFSMDLATEYNPMGIHIQCILPGYVATKMSKIKAATWMAPSPMQYVTSAQRTLGIQTRTTGYLPHTILVNVVHILDAISPKLSKWIIVKQMENIRSRAMNRITATATTTITQH